MELEKVIIFTNKREQVSGVMKIDDFDLQLPDPLNFSREVDTTVTINGDFCAPAEYDGCYLIERPADKKERADFAFAMMFAPLFERGVCPPVEHTFDPSIDTFVRRYQLFGLKLNGNVGTYDYYVANF